MCYKLLDKFVCISSSDGARVMWRQNGLVSILFYFFCWNAIKVIHVGDFVPMWQQQPT